MLAFRLANGQSIDWLVAKLAAQRWRAAIVGPHGSGKSTLLESLKPALRAAGCQVFAIALCDGRPRLPRSFINWEADLKENGATTTELNEEVHGGAGVSSSFRRLLVVDGYERLGW
jgi:ABC-type molybdenum transport system ATPase subunit/photorepair protein PhrA